MSDTVVIKTFLSRSVSDTVAIQTFLSRSVSDTVAIQTFLSRPVPDTLTTKICFFMMVMATSSALQLVTSRGSSEI